MDVRDRVRPAWSDTYIVVVKNSSISNNGSSAACTKKNHSQPHSITHATSHHLENQSDFGKLPWTNQERYTHTSEYFAIPGVMEINPKEFHAVTNSPGSLTC